MANGFKMADMKRSKESLSPKTVGKIGPDPYSYEHRITLDQGALDKLGVDKVPQVGDKFHVMGHGEVVRVSQHDEAGDKSTRVELQMKRMGVKKGAGGGLRGAVEKGIQEADEDNG